MTGAAALLLGACLVGWLAPKYLRRLSAGGRDPVIALIGWFVSISGVVVTTALAVVILLLPDHGSPLLTPLVGCWSSLQHGMPPTVESVSGLVAVALLAHLAVRSAIVGVRTARRRTRTRNEHLAVLRIAARAEPGPPLTLWLDHDEPLAFSLAGTPGVVVATEGLNRHLTRAEVDAVLAHERAHLAGRHHLLVAAADAFATMVHFLPLFTRVPAAVRELVELAADASAARSCGTEAVRTALLGVSGSGAPGSALAMSRDSVAVRLAHLDRPGRRSGRIRRFAAYALTGATAFALPALAAFGPILALVAVACSQR
jgi:Zn-dependent protease with chaperone function